MCPDSVGSERDREARADGLRREVRFNPGPDPNRIRMEWLLHGDEGVVQFVAWITGKPRAGTSGLLREYEFYVVDLGYHSPTPRYEGQMQMEACEFMPDGKGCFYDGSGLNADVLWRKAMEGGSEVLWSGLEGYYRELFPTAPEGENDE